jgi:hypothetical protein
MTAFARDYTLNEFLRLHKGKIDARNMSVLHGDYTDPAFIEDFVDWAYDYLYLIQNKLASPGFNQSIHKKFGLRAHEFFLEHKFGGKDLSAKEHIVSYYDPFYGNCFKINSGFAQNGSKVALLKQNETGKRKGLYLVNFVDIFDHPIYNFMNLLNSFTFGLKISMDDQRSIPLHKDNMIPIQPGTCTYIGLRKTQSTLEPKPYSKCTDLNLYRSVLYHKFVKHDKKYEQKACFEMCKQKKVIDQCRCAVIDYPNLDKNRTCSSMREIDCVLNLEIDTSGCDELCPLECDSISYVYSTASEFFPSYTYFDFYRNVLRDQFAERHISTEDVTFDGLSKSLACVYIYFEDMKVTRVEEAPVMSMVSESFDFASFCMNTFELIKREG